LPDGISGYPPFGFRWILPLEFVENSIGPYLRILEIIPDARTYDEDDSALRIAGNVFGSWAWGHGPRARRRQDELGTAGIDRRLVREAEDGMPSAGDRRVLWLFFG
jgi:hypothetical protein